MDTLRTLLIGTLFVAPLIALGLSLLEGKVPRRALLLAAQSAAVVVLLSAMGLFASPPQTGSLAESPLVTWLSLPDFKVTLSVRWDHLSFMQTSVAAVVLIGVLSAWPRQSSLRWLMLAWFGVMLANVAGNLGQLFLGWTLSAWASSELARPRDAGTGEASAFRPVWLVQRVSDIVMLGGFGLIWMHFGGSLSFAAWTPEAIAALRPELVESIALCVLVGVIGRCAQLPLTVWLETETGFAAQRGHSMARLSDEMVGVWNVPDGHAVDERLKADPTNRWHAVNGSEISLPVLGWWLCAAFLPMGVGLIVRCEPLLSVASHTRLLMVAVGAFTLGICSASAAAQNNWTRVLGQVSVAQCGLTLVALGLTQPLAQEAAIGMFLWQSLVLAVLFVADTNEWSRDRQGAVPISDRSSLLNGRGSKNTRRSAGLVLVAMLCLAAGLWGRQAVLNRLIEQAWPTRVVVGVPSEDAESLVFGSTESRVWLLVIGLACVSELLTSFSLLRAWFLDSVSRRGQAPGSDESVAREPDVSLAREPDASAFRLTWGLWFVIGAACLGGLLVGHVGEAGSQPPLFAVGSLILLSAVGAVLAWWLYSQPSSLPAKFSAAMGPFARLSRNRFYWGDLYFLLVVHPAQVIGEWMVWIEIQVIGRGMRSLRDGVARIMGESAEPLSRGSAMIGALATVGSVAVLAWMLLWLRS
ncbi:MAG: proton-conducting transporter membrane subunit [Planctomycetaceae bacterium]